jgi:hypothetical protein
MILGIMRQARWCGVLALLASQLVLAGTPALQQKYIGQSSCTPELKNGVGSFGVRLDKKQIARLEAHAINGKKILVIVQYQKEWDECGVVKDIVEATHDDTDFIFECMDEKNPGAVVVGTWRTPRIKDRSLESWRIRLDGLTFVRTRRPLRYVPQTLEGNDDGSDLVDWARKRVSRGKVQAGH